MSARRFVLAAACLTVLSALNACGVADEHPVEGLQRAIVNGQPDRLHTAVGGIFQQRGGMCTATLVGKRTVLTAAHCVEPGAGHLMILEAGRFEVLSVARHPAYKDDVIGTGDVAVVRLRTAPPIEPAAVGVLPPEIEQTVTLVGIGATSTAGGGSGQRRVAENTVARILSDRMSYRFASGKVGNVCFGDSGGPSFATINGQHVQVGVHSYISGQCGQEGTDMRVDAYLEWIREAAEGDIVEGGQPDELPPTVKIVSPSAGEERYPKVQVVAEAQDDRGVAQVELLVDGASTGKLEKPPFRFDLELKPGQRVLEVVAQDAVGNAGRAEVVITVVAYKDDGALCTAAEHCGSGRCQGHVAIADRYCAASCDPEGAPCAHGARCEQTSDGLVCGPPSALLPSEGCAVGETSARPQPAASAVGVGLLLALGLALRLRRGRRRV